MTQAYLRARYYDSSIGRFITEDPAKDGLNWYAFCSNNPVTFVDSSGLYFTVAEKDYNQFKESASVLYGEGVTFEHGDPEKGIYKITGINYDGDVASITGASLLKILAEDEDAEFNLLYAKEGTSQGSSKEGGQNSTIWHATIGTMGLDANEAAARLVHELAHCYADRQGYFDEVYNNIQFKKGVNTIGLNKGELIRGYREATGITVENQVRRELQRTYGEDKISMRKDSGVIDIADSSAGLNGGFGFWPWMPAQSQESIYYDKYTFKTMEARKTVGIALDIVGKAGVAITDTRFK